MGREESSSCRFWNKAIRVWPYASALTLSLIIRRALQMQEHVSGMGLSQDVLFDLERAKRLYSRKWFFAGTRGDVPKPGDFLKFTLFDDEYFLLQGTDGVIRCM